VLKSLLTALCIIWLAVICFFAFASHATVFKLEGFQGIGLLLVIFWIIYLVGLWFEQPRITDSV